MTAQSEKETYTDLHSYGLSTCGYLIPRNARVTNKQFAALVRQHFDNPRTAEVAAAFDSLSGLITSDWRGHKFTYANENNLSEIAGRNAGVTVSEMVDGSCYVQLEKCECSDELLPILGDIQFTSQKSAWDNVYQQLQRMEETKLKAQIYAATLIDALGVERCYVIYQNAFGNPRDHGTSSAVEFVQRCAGQDFEDSFDLDEDAIFNVLASIIKAKKEVTSKELEGERGAGKLRYLENELLGVVRNKQIADLAKKDEISSDDLSKLDRMGQLKVASELFEKCDSISQDLLLNDAHPQVSSAATISKDRMRIADDEENTTAEKLARRDLNYFGWITFSPSDRPILDSIGVEFGKKLEINDGAGYITHAAKVTQKSLEELDPYFGSFIWGLHPEINYDVPLEQMDVDELFSTQSYLVYQSSFPEKPTNLPVSLADVEQQLLRLRNPRHEPDPANPSKPNSSFEI